MNVAPHVPLLTSRVGKLEVVYVPQGAPSPSSRGCFLAGRILPKAVGDLVKLSQRPQSTTIQRPSPTTRLGQQNEHAVSTPRPERSARLLDHTQSLALKAAATTCRFHLGLWRPTPALLCRTAWCRRSGRASVRGAVLAAPVLLRQAIEQVARGYRQHLVQALTPLCAQRRRHSRHRRPCEPRRRRS